MIYQYDCMGVLYYIEKSQTGISFEQSMCYKYSEEFNREELIIMWISIKEVLEVLPSPRKDYRVKVKGQVGGTTAHFTGHYFIVSKDVNQIVNVRKDFK